MQVTPDWSATYTAAEIEREFTNAEKNRTFKFAGPGMYLTDTDTTLIVAEGVEAHEAGRWRRKGWPEDQKFRVHVYNVSLEKTIFGQTGQVPNRLDDRAW
jgi:hypothetical protein